MKNQYISLLHISNSRKTCFTHRKEPRLYIYIKFAGKPTNQGQRNEKKAGKREQLWRENKFLSFYIVLFNILLFHIFVFHIFQYYPSHCILPSQVVLLLFSFHIASFRITSFVLHFFFRKSPFLFTSLLF